MYQTRSDALFAGCPRPGNRPSARAFESGKAFSYGPLRVGETVDLFLETLDDLSEGYARRGPHRPADIAAVGKVSEDGRKGRRERRNGGDDDASLHALASGV
jgi:hypothetical protein